MLQPITESPRTLGELRDLVNRLCELVNDDQPLRIFNADSDEFEYAGGHLFNVGLRFSPIGCVIFADDLVDVVEDNLGEVLFTLEEVEAGMHRQEDEEE